MTPFAALLCSLTVSPQAFDPASVPEFASGFEIVTELADWDQDGRVTSDEVTDLVAWIGPFTERVEDVTTELMFQGLDRDTLKDWTLHDVRGSLDALDGNGDGLIEASEATLERLCSGRTGTRGVIRRLAHELLLEEADQDADGQVTSEEREALLASLLGAPTVGTFSRWIENGKTREAADRNRMAPGVAFFTLEGDIDQDRDEWFDVDRYRSWFAGRDTDLDGALSMAERSAPQAQMDEEFWREPTAARMALPALMPWQRNLEDALAVQRRTGQPLLICVNMDGETACDALAAWRYRDPGFAKLASGYVCLVVSPDDHQPRDYDDRGRRMVSPRLGRVTDAEHIELEPELFARYFNDRRVAPRHVGVAPDGTILFDVYLINNPSQLDAELRKHGKAAASPSWAEMETAELAGYPDALAREEMERRMLAGDPAQRLAAAAFVGSMPDAGMIGLRDPDPAVREASALALASNSGALGAVHMQRLVAAAGSLAAEARDQVRAQVGSVVDASSPVARSLGLLNPEAMASSLGSASDWRAAASLATLYAAPVVGRDAALSALERLDEVAEPESATPAQAFVRAGALLQLAQAFADAGEDPRDAAAEAAVFARKAATVDPWRASAMEAVAAGIGGDYAAAVGSARLALPGLWAVPSDPLTLSTLRALRTGATQLVYAQITEKKPVGRTLVADAVLAGRTLVAHSAGAESDATMLLDLVSVVGDPVRAPELLLEAVTRFPASAELHRRFRAGVLESMGAGSMAAQYDMLDGSLPDSGYGPTVTWFRGLALLVAAEWEQGQGDSGAAMKAYEGSIEAFEASVAAEPTFEDSALHYLVLSHAGAASLAVDAKALDEAAEHMQAAATLRPSTLDLTDGLGVTPRQRALKILPAIMPTLDEEHQAAFRRVFPGLE
jgi:Ca2+-binding EF-hand superfamily protein